MEWHGYEVAEDAVPSRPWWSSAQYGRLVWPAWVRVDGLLVQATGPASAVVSRTGGVFEAVDVARPDSDDPSLVSVLGGADRMHPLPAPPPKCGQVWVGRGGDQHLVTFVQGFPHWDEAWQVCLGRHQMTVAREPVVDPHDPNRHHDERWPPRGAVLVAGPGSPWGPEASGGA